MMIYLYILRSNRLPSGVEMDDLGDLAAGDPLLRCFAFRFTAFPGGVLVTSASGVLTTDTLIVVTSGFRLAEVSTSIASVCDVSMSVTTSAMLSSARGRHRT